MLEYFSTDWAAMTTNDWIGTGMTVVTFLLMVGLYFHVLRPSNKDKFEQHRDIPIKE